MVAFLMLALLLGSTADTDDNGEQRWLSSPPHQRCPSPCLSAARLPFSQPARGMPDASRHLLAWT